MGSSKKVLKVSYGTFSCTLEGFDDSVGTMKTIVDYFRDIARVDGDFGTEPPSPEVLERFARSEISRRVATRMTEGGDVVLHASVPDTDEARDTEEGFSDDAKPGETPDRMTPEADGEAGDMSGPAWSDDPVLEDEAEWNYPSEAWQDDEQMPPDFDAEPVGATSGTTDGSQDDDTPDFDFAALMKLGEIDGSAGPDGSAEDAAAEEGPEPEAADATEDDDAEPLGLGAYATGEDAATEDAAPENKTGDAPDEDAPPGAHPAEDQDDEADEPAQAEKSFEPLSLAAFSSEKNDDYGIADAGDDDQNGAWSYDEDEDLARELAALEAEFAGHSDEDTETGQDRYRDADEDVFGRELDAAFGGPERRSEHIDEEDDHVLSQTDDADEDHALTNARRAVKMASRGRAMLTETPVEDSGEDVSRLMDETQKEFEEPEGSRRRTAIAHLRAAVAATRADRLIGRRKSDADMSEPYREDLATVVQPRRPTGPVREHDGPERRARPGTSYQTGPNPRSTPLTLVAEQRVDEGEAEARPDPAPIQPRRVRFGGHPAQDPASAPEESFADFVLAVGARSLTERIEAAAVYLTHFEGRADFTRPELMTRLKELDEEVSSRDDRLRCFGRLLNEGKIEKLEEGRFTASDRIAYRPGPTAG